MKEFVQDEDRIQATSLPYLVDDYVAETHPIRVADIFADEFDLDRSGISRHG